MKRTPLKQKTPLKRKTPLVAKKGLQAKTSLKAKKPGLKSRSLSTKTSKPRKSLEEKSSAQLIKEADKYFSRRIRLRDSQRVNNEYIGTCITCSKTGTVAYWDEEGKLRFVLGWDNGHFIGRGTKILRFNEQNCNLQCSFRCNKMRSGEHEKYKGALDDKYGKGTYRGLEKIAAQYPTYKLKKDELLEIIYESKAEVASYTL